MVGLSSNPARPSHDVAAYLQDAGYRIIPVNPQEREVLGVPAVPDLRAIAGLVDVVEVFRPLGRGRAARRRGDRDSARACSGCRTA